MRLLLVAAIVSGLALPAAAQTPGAREAYVERRGLIEADERCGLLRAELRAALNIGAAQARGALLRAGWSNAQLGELENATLAAARARACNDARTLEAASQAQRSLANWANLGTMEFPGWQRRWTARRTADAQGWRLSQAIDLPLPSVFGVREREGGQRLSLIAAPPAAPRAATLTVRDTRRARFSEVSLPQRVAYGLSAGAPPATARRSFAATVRSERDAGRMLTVLEFPDAAFQALLELDPRESVEIEVRVGGSSERLMIEVGDVGAARAFLTLRR